ncbi:MAG TPA: hypothetical protein VKA15_17100 [Isosphaeraceae bacterium]|nr:hypothetical protein [Isosphaeraceae bacterium]
MDYSTNVFETGDELRTKSSPSSKRYQRRGVIYRAEHELGALPGLGDGFEEVGSRSSKVEARFPCRRDVPDQAVPLAR